MISLTTDLDFSYYWRRVHSDLDLLCSTEHALSSNGRDLYKKSSPNRQSLVEIQGEDIVTEGLITLLHQSLREGGEVV